MTYEELIEEVQRRAGLESVEEAERTLLVTARVLGARLMPDEAGPIAAVMPEPVAARLRDAVYERDFEVDELFERVARGEGSGRHFGKEHAQAVCQLMGEALSDSARMLLQRHLGPTYAPLFEPRGPLSRPSRPLRFSTAVEPGRGNTLATGRPGAHHPLSEGRADRAQSESVAREADPHGDVKLSSSAGLTQERLEESLAAGRPGPAHPLSNLKR